VHILPPFPSSGDRGFAPLTYLEIDPRFGTWDDIRRIGGRFNLVLDLMVNHISRASTFFQDFLRHGRRSAYADLFITVDKVWPDGRPPREEVERIFLRRAEPFSQFVIQDTGEKETVWTTFGRETPSEQIDLDLRSGAGRKLLGELLRVFRGHNVAMIRLDAVGYVVKKRGTSCFFVEPEIYEYLEWFSGMAHSLGLEVLPELHAHPSRQLALAQRGYWIYDFILPGLLLEAFLSGRGGRLAAYLRERPPRQITMLDCHDGIPIKPDLDGLMDAEAARRVVDACLRRGANLSRVVSAAHQDPTGFDVHQIRISYYSALGGDDDAYIAARAVQFFAPGVPQVYYVGLLAGENDLEGVRLAGGEGRAINRRNYSLPEIEEALQKPVVRRLLRLMRFRNTYPAFTGKFRVLESSEGELRLSWEKDDAKCELTVDLQAARSSIRYLDTAGLPHDDII
jgi:sucrose phosphorylase